MNSTSGAVDQTGRMDSDTKQWLFAAAERAKLRHPGAIGELLSQELLSWMVFGHQLGSDLIMRVADDLLVGKQPPS
ncbi:MAG: hypothetical protein JWR81_478 [Pseudonocardia sp.]|nr:hypothetical protein [Pseudonocardia sp.]